MALRLSRQPRRYTLFKTRARVLAGLRAAAVTIWGSDEKRLPTSTDSYRREIMKHEPVRSGQPRRMYPSDTSVLIYFASITEAWSALGFDVPVRMRGKERKYVFTDEIDAKLRDIYSRPAARMGGNNFRDKGKGVKAYAAEIGYPHWVLVKRASELGIARVKEKPWTSDELATLRESAHFTPAHIWRIFKARGFKRSESSIACMRKKVRALAGAPWYSGHALATLMGVDGHMVSDVWVAKGLKFITKGSQRGKKNRKQGGDTRLFHQAEVRRFLVEHPEEIDLLKVDKYWFLDLITEGAIKQLKPSKRLSIRFEARQPTATRLKAAPRRRAKAA